MAKERRYVYDYCHEQQFLFRIGHVQLHTHGTMIEFVYLERGSQNYSISGTNYIVNQGEVFSPAPMNRTIPELHSLKFPHFITLSSI